MSDDPTEDLPEPGVERQAAKVGKRMPGFVSDEQIGLGDVVTRLTSALGLKPCDGCRRRAQVLNRLFTIRR